MDYPMHEKLKAQEEPHRWCGEFYEYLVSEGAVPEELAEMRLAGFFRIDLKAFEAEEEELIKELTATQPVPQPRPAD